MKTCFHIFVVLYFASTVLWPHKAIAQNYIPWHQDETILNHSMDNIVHTIFQCEEYDEWFPHVKYSRKLSRNQCYLESKIASKMFWMRVNINPLRTSQDKKIAYIYANKMQGNIEHFEAKVNVSYLNKNKSRVIFRVKANPGLPGILDSIVQKYVKKTIYQALTKLSSRLDSKAYSSDI